MGKRRKNKFMSDNDSSGDSSNEGGDDPNDAFDPDDPDAAAERELFRNPYGSSSGRKRHRDDQNDTNDWGDPQQRRTSNRNAKGKKVDYTKYAALNSSS
jgi:hypothetical protein